MNIVGHLSFHCWCGWYWFASATNARGFPVSQTAINGSQWGILCDKYVRFLVVTTNSPSKHLCEHIPVVLSTLYKWTRGTQLFVWSAPDRDWAEEKSWCEHSCYEYSWKFLKYVHVYYKQIISFSESSLFVIVTHTSDNSENSFNTSIEMFDLHQIMGH